MTDLSRRQFFKLVAAGAAVAFVPIVVTEATAAPVPTIAEPVTTKIIHRALWQITRYDIQFSANEFMTMKLRLRRGNAHAEIEMLVDAADRVLNVGDEIGLEVRTKQGQGPLVRFELLSDGVVLPGVLSVYSWTEREMIEETSIFGDTYRSWRPIE